MHHLIVGTCGHIDHGKTSLIKAINGFEGDTLKEEKQRGITIDLSFSNISKGGRNIAFIDVPGHEKLVKNMISGAFGFDAAMVIVSAVEGVKPQTVEHLEILRLLGVKDALLVISKKDLLSERELASKMTEIEAFVARYPFNLHAVVPVSIYDNASIERLKESLFALEPKKRKEQPFFRLYIDRVFHLKGRGSIVTGTVLGRSLSIKEKLVVCESGKSCRIRTMQVHGKEVGTAAISSRVALNLTSVDAKELQKGYLLSQKGYLRGFRTIDIHFTSLGREESLQHNRHYLVYIGAKRVEAKLTLFESNESQQEGFASIKASQPFFAVYGEKLIIRDGNRTLAGATVLNPIADPLRKKQKIKLLRALKESAFPKAYTVLLEAHKKGLGLLSSAQRFALSHEEALAEAKLLENVFVDAQARIVYPLASQKIITDTVRSIYAKNPYALLSVSSLQRRLPWASERFMEAALEHLLREGLLKKEMNLYQNATVQEVLRPLLEERILSRIKKEGIAPAAPYDIFDALDLDRKEGDALLKGLCSKKEVIRVTHNLFVSSKSLKEMLHAIRELIRNEGSVDIGRLKTAFPLSRKYLIAYLEYLDRFSDIRNEQGTRSFR